MIETVKKRLEVCNRLKELWEAVASLPEHDQERATEYVDFYIKNRRAKE